MSCNERRRVPAFAKDDANPGFLRESRLGGIGGFGSAMHPIARSALARRQAAAEERVIVQKRRQHGEGLTFFDLRGGDVFENEIEQWVKIFAGVGQFASAPSRTRSPPAP